MNWKIKAVLQKGLSYFPIGDKLNHLAAKQHKDYHTNVFKYQFFECLRKFNLTNLELKDKDLKALEIGTGYSIISPVTLYLLGFKHILSVDITNDISFIDFKKQFNTIQSKNIKSILIENSIFNNKELDLKIQEIESLLNLEELFEYCNIMYIPNYKISDIDDLKTTFNYIYSQVVLEHIPPKILELLFSKFNTWLNDNGYSVHTINFIDHFTNPGIFQDKNISEFNFLKYSNAFWKFWSGNSIAYTNRLCYHYYLELCDTYNFKSYDFKGENYRPHLHLDESQIHLDIKNKYKNSIQIKELQMYQRGTLIIKN